MYSHTHKHTRTEFKVDYIFPLEMGACKRGEYTFFFFFSTLKVDYGTALLSYLSTTLDSLT